MLPLQQLKQLYSNEQVLLVLLARLYFSTATPEEVQDFIRQHPPDEKRLYSIARAHRLRPFIYSILTRHCIPVSSHLAAKLQQDYRIASMRNMQLSAITTRLINEFGGLGIRLIPYKGVVLTHHAYGDMGLRESSDIDFLVSPQDVEAIEDHFIANGYAAKQTVPRSYLWFQKKFFKEIVYDTPADKNGDTYSIEIHWTLTDRHAGSFPGYSFFAPHTQPHRIAALSMHKLQPAYDFLVVASNHFVKDMFVRFRYITDIAGLLKRYNGVPDPELLLSVGRQYHCTKKLLTGLSIVEQLIGIPSRGPGVPQQVPASFLATPLRYPVLLPRLQFDEKKFLKRSLELQDNAWQKCRFLLRCFLYIFIPTYVDINKFRLPGYFLPLLIVLRPFRLLFEKIRPRKTKHLES